MDAKALREKVKAAKGNLVPGGMAITAVQMMIKAEVMLFRGWNADLGMYSPDNSQTFQIEVRSTTVHDKECEMLSEVAKEFEFNYYIDTISMGNPKDARILIRCRLNPGVKT